MTIFPMCCDVGSIAFDHVLPASADLYTPLPHDELRMLFASPVPTQRTSGLDGATAIAPTEPVRTESNTGVHDTPALVVRQTPAVAPATYITVPRRARGAFGLSTTAMSDT